MGKLLRKDKGFNIIELLVVMLVIISFAAFAYPAYINLQLRYYFADISTKVAPYKAAITKCHLLLNTFIGCDGGKQKIPANIKMPEGKIASLTVKNGVITVIPVPGKGVVASDNFILTPTYKDQAVSFIPSGDAVAKKYIE